jgi:uncharacterized protein
MKFVILLIAVVVLVGMLSASLRRLKGPKNKPPASPPQGRVEDMRACAHCGVHMPARDMVMDGERAYCSPAHRSAGPASGAS